MHAALQLLKMVCLSTLIALIVLWLAWPYLALFVGVLVLYVLLVLTV